MSASSTDKESERDSYDHMNKLFPVANNLAVRGSHRSRKIIQPFTSNFSYENKGNNFNHSDLESLDDSIDTNILKDIAVEYGRGGINEHLVNNRYWLSDEYSSKDQKHTEKTTSLENQFNEFTQYNKKVEKEYHLREKLDKIMKNRGNVEVLNSEGLNKLYCPSQEDEVKQKASIPRFFKSQAQRLKSVFTNKRNEPVEKNNLSQERSNGTEVLDDKLSVWNIDQHLYYRTIDDELYERPNGASNSSNQEKDTQHRQHVFKTQFHSSKNSQAHNSVQRVLTTNHLTMIAVGTCLGVGLFILSSHSLYVAGPLGTLLGFLGCGSIVISTLLSFSEISTFIPLSSGFSGLASRFVSDAVGFAVGWCYWLTYSISLPNSIVTGATILQSYFPNRSHTIVAVISVTLHIIICSAINLLSARQFGNSMCIAGYIKIIIAVLLIIVMIVMNTGGAHTDYVGFRYWDKDKSPSSLELYGPFRPKFNVEDYSSTLIFPQGGIGGATGRFLSVIFSTVSSVYAFTGVEVSFVGNVEARNPRSSLPTAIKTTFTTVILIYVLSIFLIGLNIFSGDPRLHAYYTNTKEIEDYVMNSKVDSSCAGNLRILNMMSPWVLALQNFGFCTFAKGFNAILYFFSLTSGCSALYASSRSLYTLSVQNKAPSIFNSCNRYGVPYMSVLFSGIFQFVSYLAVNKKSISNFKIFTDMASLLISIMWCVMDISFLRFFYALKERPDIISRDDPAYPYKSPMQPYMAIYGLSGCICLILLMGFTNFLKQQWVTRDFITSYGSLVIFMVLYCSYFFFGSSKIQSLDQLDLDSGRKEMDRDIWNENTEYDDTFKKRFYTFFQSFK